MKTANNTMTGFTITLLVNQSPAEVFNAVNNVKGWWTENLTGRSQELHDEFEVRFEDVHYSKQQLTEVIPNKKVVWLVTGSRLTFVENKSEWTGSQICFDIEPQGNKTLLRFTHQGLVPECECYEACAGAWGDYINYSLSGLIATGKGKPDPKTM
jgi:hypothetical protein